MPVLEESVLVESKTARDGQLAKLTHERSQEILSGIEKANGLMFALWQGTGIATTEQVAEFYEVPDDTVRTAVKINRDELESDGLKVLKGKDLKDARSIFDLTSKASQVLAWTPRATVRLGMFLRDSLVAKAVRTRILDSAEAEARGSSRKQDAETYSVKVINQARLLMAEFGLDGREAFAKAEKMVDAERESLKPATTRKKVRAKKETPDYNFKLRPADYRILAAVTEEMQPSWEIVEKCGVAPARVRGRLAEFARQGLIQKKVVPGPVLGKRPSAYCCLWWKEQQQQRAIVVR